MYIYTCIYTYIHTCVHFSLPQRWIIGCRIIKRCSNEADVAVGFTCPPRLRAMWAQLPPKSSSLYVQHRLGRPSPKHSSRNKWSLGLIFQYLAGVAASKATNCAANFREFSTKTGPAKISSDDSAR